MTVGNIKKMLRLYKSFKYDLKCKPKEDLTWKHCPFRLIVAKNRLFCNCPTGTVHVAPAG